VSTEQSKKVASFLWATLYMMMMMMMVNDDVDYDDVAASLLFHETNYPFLAVVLPINNGMAVVGYLQGWHGTIFILLRQSWRSYVIVTVCLRSVCLSVCLSFC